jgi:predicted DNA-binding transcriptional regulator YafY
LVDRRDLAFHYEARSDSASSDRRVSPQRLIRYRGCWYLDAWCHDRNALRTFALERMTNTRVLQDRARNLPESDLDAHYTAAYGVFSGPATATAVLRIEPGRARWVGDEEWHPQQSGAWLDDGCYELRVPYGRSEELILDILRLGADVEVVGPPELRAAVLARLQTAVGRYDEKRRKRDGTSKKVASVMD